MPATTPRQGTLHATKAPLADRMRPRTLDEFVGQDELVGQGRLLRRAIEADRLSSIILHGPPGTGKTTLARVIANTTEAQFTTLNAVLSGVKDIREAVADAKDSRERLGRRTILFIDEVHRFNKAQQDALLPWVENGTVILIGATTENPYFEVNKALVSRSRVFQLRPLDDAALESVGRAALADPDRGYGKLDVRVDDDALAHLINIADGDARAVLNALELAVETTPPDAAGEIHVDLAVAEESIQRRAVLYDKEGDAHYDTISAFIKSLRGSDPDAALYWLARMVYAGEDPRFLFRRMLILASEDVGLADPEAVGVVAACAQAFDYVGLPEGQFHLAEAALYLALAPKSNSSLGYFDALDTVQRERADDIPTHLKDANRDREAFGHGEGYRYPHAYQEHWVAQHYLPGGLRGKVFYQPSREGREGALAGRTAARREALLAAAEDGERGEVLTFTGPLVGRRRAAWLDKVTAGASERLAGVRDALLDGVALERHGLVLDLAAGTGLLTWEALRRAPEGGVWALATPEDAEVLAAMAEGLAPLDRPTIVVGTAATLDRDLARWGDVRFDAVVGRDPFGAPADLGGLDLLAARLRPGGRVALALSGPDSRPRPSALVAAERLEPALRDRVAAAELAWLDVESPACRTDDVVARLEAAGLRDVAAAQLAQPARLELTPELLERWLEPDAVYRDVLRRALDPEAVEVVVAALRGSATEGPRPWTAVTTLVLARAAT